MSFFVSSNGVSLCAERHDRTAITMELFVKHTIDWEAVAMQYKSWECLYAGAQECSY